MVRLLLLLGVVVVLVIFIRWLFRQPASVSWQWITIVIAVALLLMVATGRAHWLTVIFAALLPFVRAILALLSAVPLLNRILASMRVAQSAAGPSDGQTSSVNSKYIHMTLFHDSGDIDGEVLHGRFKGRQLNQLDIDELLQLLDECQDDEESVALLQAYLDRVYEDEWRERAGASDQQQTTGGSGELTRHEAMQILGLTQDPSEEEIIAAHRRLMQKLHPDRGGSTYLAAKINLAKEVLLGK
jgi:hypothetical protein